MSADAASSETALALARARICDALAAGGDGKAALTVAELAALARAAASVARAETALLGERRAPRAGTDPTTARRPCPPKPWKRIGRRLYGIGA